MEIKVGQIWERKEIGRCGQKYYEVITIEDRDVFGVHRNDNWEIIGGEYREKINLLADFTLSSHYKQGDMLVDKDGDERKILGICGEVYFISWSNDFTKILHSCTEQELDGMGLKLKFSPSKVELSMNEIAEKFGVDVGSLKIKKD